MITLASPLTPVILRLLGLRRTAIVVAAVLLTWITIQASLTWLIQASNTVALLTVFAVELAALIASDGPRRGLRLVTWKGLLMAASWLVVAVTVGLDNDPGNAGVHVSRYLIALAIAAGAGTLASAKARRLLLLFAIPLSPFVIFIRPYETSVLVMYLAPGFMSLIAFFVSGRSRHKQQPDQTIGNVA